MNTINQGAASGELLALAERVEAATGPDRGLDCLIQAAIQELPQTCVDYEDAPKFTASIDAAMTLVPEGWWVGRLSDTTDTITEWQTGPWVVQLLRSRADGKADHASSEHGSTPALALCAAALKARAAQGGE